MKAFYSSRFSCELSDVVAMPEIRLFDVVHGWTRAAYCSKLRAWSGEDGKWARTTVFVAVEIRLCVGDRPKYREGAKEGNMHC